MDSVSQVFHSTGKHQASSIKHQLKLKLKVAIICKYTTLVYKYII